jgi:chromosome segregation ATPase
LSDFALRLGLALIVVIVAGAAIIISRRNYAKSADSERSIGSFRLELQRSIDAAQATTIKTIRDNVFSLIKTINSTMRDLSVRLASLEERADETATHLAETQNFDGRLASLEQHTDATATYTQNLHVRLARLQEHADETAAHIAGTQNLDVRLARLEERAEETAAHIAGAQNLDARLGRLEERADETATHIAETQNLDARLARSEERAEESAAHIAETEKISLEANERIAARLAGLEQNIMALSEQLSSIKQALNEATVRQQGINDSIEAINSRVVNSQSRVDELFPRLVVGEKALKDLGALISLFVRRLKRIGANSTETAVRLGGLEAHFRSKVRQLEEHRSSSLESNGGPSTTDTESRVEDATPKAADGAVPIEIKADGENAGFEPPLTPSKESSNEANAEGARQL